MAGRVIAIHAAPVSAPVSAPVGVAAAVAVGPAAAAPTPRLARFGHALARHRRPILVLQWLIVVAYAVLVILPAELPLPATDSHLWAGGAAVAPWHDRLVLFAQYLFWGVWWPFVIVSILVAGRFWCGLFCPEGALAEFASRRGLGLPIPRLLRWPGWPFLGFVLTTVYGQLISVYEYPQAALLILGGSTLAAMGVGLLFGRGKRVWCRYLCPVSGVFALLGRLAPLHFRVDRAAWQAFPARLPAVDCPPLLSVRRLNGMASCHACGRCSGHRGAVTLTARTPTEEVLGGDLPTTHDALLLHFGLLGVAIGAFQWTLSPWFVAAKQAAAAWLLERDILWPFADSPAWWLLTRQPQVGDVFSWLDGAALIVWIGTFALGLGGLSWRAVMASARLAGVDWRRLSLGLTPLAGIGLFIGLSMMTITHLRAEGVVLSHLAAARGVLLGAAAAASVYLGIRLIGPSPRRWAARAVYLLPVAAVSAVWSLVLFAD